MKLYYLLLFIVLSSIQCLEAQETTGKVAKIDLVGGDSITGTVSGTRDGSVSVITDYGVIRVPITKITESSRRSLGISADQSAADLQKRITELEDLVLRLRAENADLRKQLSAGGARSSPPIASAGTNGAVAKLTPSPTSSGGAFWMSSTGKRHNPRCRYYGTGKGRSCGASDGVGCKICGG